MVTENNYTNRGEHFVMYITVRLLCHTPETNILYVNYTSIKNKF